MDYIIYLVLVDNAIQSNPIQCVQKLKKSNFKTGNRSLDGHIFVC